MQDFQYFFCSKLQTEIALSKTEAEYIASSHTMNDPIPFMELMKEISFISDVRLQNPEENTVGCESGEFGLLYQG